MTRPLGSGSGRAARPAVTGVSAVDLAQTVTDFFDQFPWQPPAQTVLAQWEVSSFFERFVR